MAAFKESLKWLFQLIFSLIRGVYWWVISWCLKIFVNISGFSRMANIHCKNLNIVFLQTDIWIPVVFRGHENIRRPRQKSSILFCWFVSGFSKCVAFIYLLRRNVDRVLAFIFLLPAIKLCGNHAYSLIINP